MDRKAFQDLLHLTDAERSALTDRLTRAATEMPGGAGWSAEIDELETAAQRAVATPG